ncbi:LysR family transcriptional regulator [Ferrimonas pelagia]|uniref:LysR family transcriptional regulator n=1 Tax=Ferrimonas pelagia TaxID=1177826 RepID=A0ABP9ELY5_9GAMM
MTAPRQLKDLGVIHLQLIQKLLIHRSTADAGKELGLSQSSVSYHLKNLRVLFDDELFVRYQNGLKPTEHCQRLSHHINDILSRIEDDLLQCGSFDPANVQKELWVVTDPTCWRWHPLLLAELKKRTPRVTLTTQGWNSQSFKELEQGRVHFGVHILTNTPAHFHNIPLGPTERVFIMRKGHPLAQHGKVALQDLTQYPVLIHHLSGWNCHGQSVMENVLKAHNLQLNLKARLSDSHALFEALKYSNAITYSSVLALPYELSDYALLPAPPELTQVKTHYSLYISGHRYGSQETSFMTELLYDSFQSLYEETDRPEISRTLMQQNELLEDYLSKLTVTAAN